MASATDMRVGTVIEKDKTLFLVTRYAHVTPGNLRGFVQVTLKNLRTGIQHDERIRSTDKVEIAHLEGRDLEYLYPEGDKYCFMDAETYEQSFLGKEILEGALPFLKLNLRVRASFYNDLPVSIELPASVVLKIEQTDPGLKGDSATNVFKPAKLETGHEIKVPLFMNTGDLVKVDTRTGEFLERVNASKS